MEVDLVGVVEHTLDDGEMEAVEETEEGRQEV